MGELRGLEASRKGALTTPSVGGLLPERRITPDASCNLNPISFPPFPCAILVVERTNRAQKTDHLL
jgi:hypothetical protein